MKSLGFGLFGLLICTALAWADNPTTKDPLALQQNDAEVLPIISSFNYVDNDDEANIKYGLSLFKMNWFGAEQYCASQGFTLASITTAAEQTAIMAFILAEVDTFDLMTFNTEPIWTSGTNQAVVNRYMWHSTGTRVGYNNFLSSPKTNTFLCLTLNGMTGFWSTDNCRTERYFLCQKKCT